MSPCVAAELDMTLTAEHVQHDGGGVEVRGRARVVARVLASRVVDDQVADLKHHQYLFSILIKTSEKCPQDTIPNLVTVLGHNYSSV